MLSLKNQLDENIDRCIPHGGRGSYRPTNEGIKDALFKVVLCAAILGPSTFLG